MKKEVLSKIGKELKKQRLKQKMTLENISQQLKIRKASLRAIENGNDKILKFDVYTLGYIRGYAKLLEFDLEPFAELLNLKDKKNPIPAITSKNLITGKDFLPSKKLVLITTGLLVALYIFVEILTQME